MSCRCCGRAWPDDCICDEDCVDPGPLHDPDPSSDVEEFARKAMIYGSAKVKVIWEKE